MAGHDTVSRQSLLLCGFALQIAWMFVIYRVPLQMDIVGTHNMITAPLSLLPGFSLIAVLVVCGIGYRRVQRALESRLFLICCSIILMACTFAEHGLPEASPTNYFINLIARAATAMLLLGWMRVFANFDTATVLKAVPSIMAFSTALAVLVASLLSTAIEALLILLPVLSATSLLVAQSVSRAAMPYEQTAPLRPLITTCVVAFAFSLLAATLCAFSHYTDDDEFPALYYLYFLLMTGVALLALSGTAFVRSSASSPGRHASSAVSPRAWLPVAWLVIAFALGTVLQPDMRTAANCVGRSCLEVALIVAFLIMARRMRRSPIQLYAFGQAAFLLGSLPDMIAVLDLLGIRENRLMNLGVLILLLACQTVLAFLSLFASIQKTERQQREDEDERGADALLADDDASPAENDDAPARHGATIPYAFAQRYGLSDQEAEVFRMTIKGRSRQRISEELFIAPGTVSTYLHRIYQKTQVANRQELLDLVDEFRQEQKS